MRRSHSPDGNPRIAEGQDASFRAFAAEWNQFERLYHSLSETFPAPEVRLNVGSWFAKLPRGSNPQVGQLLLQDCLLELLQSYTAIGRRFLLFSFHKIYLSIFYRTRSLTH